jgi:hypothetical protein
MSEVLDIDRNHAIDSRMMTDVVIWTAVTPLHRYTASELKWLRSLIPASEEEDGEALDVTKSTPMKGSSAVLPISVPSTPSTPALESLISASSTAEKVSQQHA